MCKVKNICHDARGALDFPKSILSTHNAILNQTLTIFPALHCNCFTAVQACLVILLAQGGDGGRGGYGGGEGGGGVAWP
jgi:uncharacterized membrane protein